MSGAAAARGIFETHLAVRDLAASVAFYRDVAGLEFAYEVPERNVAFMWVGGRGHAMLGLWSIGSAPLGVKWHFAFECALEDVLAAPQRLRASGVQPLDFDDQPTDEAVVIGWMPAASVYFRDPDGHSLEFIAMLDEPARPDFGVQPFSRWLARAP